MNTVRKADLLGLNIYQNKFNIPEDLEQIQRDEEQLGRLLDLIVIEVSQEPEEL